MKRIVMLVEPNTSVPKNLLMALGHEGYAVHIVGTVDSVQEDMNTGLYGVIITDADRYTLLQDELTGPRPEIFGVSYLEFDASVAEFPEIMEGMKAELVRAFEEFAG